MKKIIFLFAFLLSLAFAVTAYAYNTPDLNFEKKQGRYIYSNNPENITRTDLADSSNVNAKFLMNNEGLTADSYSLFVSHYNHTELLASDSITMTEPGFDIEVDVLFKANEDSEFVINNLGFEVPSKETYWLDGKKYTEDSPIGCMNAWASYLGLPIRQLDSGNIYTPTKFEPVTVSLKKGESVWLSQFIPNYSTVMLYRTVHILSDFDIKYGNCDVNVAALKSTGTLRDRSTFNENAMYSPYRRDRQYKGISDNMNVVEANLDFDIDYYVYYGMAMPVKIYNGSYPNGSVTDAWHTHCNPSNDGCAKSATDESNMLAFKYKDDSKLKYYGRNVKDSEKENIWYFDTSHNDLSAYLPDCGSRAYFKPNTNDRYESIGYSHCNLGNYGVKTYYNISATNSTNSIRYAMYKIRSNANVIVILYDENGNVVSGYPMSKGYTEKYEDDIMACITLPPGKTTKFRLCIILPTNYYGDIANSIIIKTEPEAVESYNSDRQYITKKYNTTGREFYKWENRKLYFSDDAEIWTYKPLDEKVSNIVFGRWDEFQLVSYGDGYILYTGKMSGIYFYQPQKFFRDIYYLDSDLNYKDKYTFPEYPSSVVSANNMLYADAEAVYSSSDGKTWSISGSGVTMPVYNYGRFSASCKNKNISVSPDGVSFYRVSYEDDSPEYIDSYAGAYFSAEGNNIYLSNDGVYWQKENCGEKINTVYATGERVVVNDKYTYVINEDKNTPVIILNGQVIGYKDKPYLSENRLVVPRKFTEKMFGIAASDDQITDGYIILRKYAEENGYSVEWDSVKNTVYITKNNN